MTTSQTRSGGVTRLAIPIQFLTTALIWGASFLFIAIALEGLSPAGVVTGRLVFGALTLWGILAWRRYRARSEQGPVQGPVLSPVGPPTPLRHIAVLSFTQCIVPWMLFAWAEQHITSGLTSIYNATTALLVIPLALVALPGERISRWAGIGGGVGFLGVLLVLAPWRDGLAGALPAHLACLGATASYAISIVYLRKYVLRPGIDSLTVTASYIGAAAAVMVLASPLTLPGTVHLTPAVVGAIVALGSLGTGLAMFWNTNVLRAWGPARSATVTYLSPLVGVVLGVLVLGERVSVNEPLGAALIIAGLILGARR